MSGKHEPLNILPMSKKKLARLAEDEGYISVGGLAVELGLPVTCDQMLDDPNRGYYDMEGKPISLRAAMALKEEKGKAHNGLVVIAEDKVGDKVVRSVWLSDAFEDELRGEKPAIPRVYGTCVATENPFALTHEFRSNHLQVRDRHREIVEALKQGPEAFEAVRKKFEEDQVN